MTDALQDGAGHRRAIVAGGEAGEDGAQRRVVRGRAFTGQVGQEQGRTGARVVAELGEKIARLTAGDVGPPGEAGRGRQHHAHLVPDAGKRMAEGVDGGRRIGGEAIGRHPQHAGGAQREEGVAGGDRAEADGRGGIVARPAGDDRRVRHAPAGGEVRRQPAGRRGALDEARHLSAREAAGGESFVRPVAFRRIEPERAGGVGHVLDRLAGQPQADEGLGQEDLGDRCEDLRLVLRHPEEFRRGEAGHGEVAGDGVKRRETLLEGAAFGEGATVVPQDGRPQHSIAIVEQHRAVHLAGQADADDPRQLEGMVGGEFVDGGERRHDPALRVLFRPVGMGTGDDERPFGDGDDMVALVDQNRLDARRADVETEIHRGPPLSSDRGDATLRADSRE